MRKLYLYYQTVKYLKPVQIFGRLWFCLYKPRPDTRPAPNRRIISKEFILPCLRKQSIYGPVDFYFFNKDFKIISAEDWNSPALKKLCLYHLHYFDDLNAVDGKKRSMWHMALIKRWIRENPPGHGNGWEAYPVSLRIVNWVKWILRGHKPGEEMIQSLAQQARFLFKRQEIHLLGNHLLANAKALVFAGLFFQGQESEKWYRRGMHILKNQFAEQILSDGGHFERTPMYHLLVMEDLLDLINLHWTCSRDCPKNWDGYLRSMLRWSRIMRHPDGDIPFFNDAAFGFAPSPGCLDAYAQRLGTDVEEDNQILVHLKESGYVRLQNRDAVVLADLAPVGPDYIPGHAHADTLSFELSLKGQRIVVNGGTSDYEPGHLRLVQRGTSAHATMCVDESNSSEIWSSFRVAKRAGIIHSEVWANGNKCGAIGAHDGYKKIIGSPVHKRSWQLQPGQLEIHDELLGAGCHSAEILFPFASGLRPEIINKEKVRVVDERGEDIILYICGLPSNLFFIEPCFWYPRFGVACSAWRLRICRVEKLPLSQKVLFKWKI